MLMDLSVFFNCLIYKYCFYHIKRKMSCHISIFNIYICDLKYY